MKKMIHQKYSAKPLNQLHQNALEHLGQKFEFEFDFDLHIEITWS